MYAWIHQHVLGHHPYTNIDGADPDIVTAARVSRWVWLQMHMYMHAYIIGHA